MHASGPHFRSLIAAGLAAGAVNLSCNDKQHLEMVRTIQSQTEQIDKLEHRVVQQQATLHALRKQISDQVGIKGDPLEELIIPVKIVLASRSGGYDEDDPAGDDGIKLYIRPIDRHGHIIETAGSIKVSLFDLAEPSDRNKIQDYTFDEATTQGLWHGRFLTNHFTVRCPWPPGHLPRHPDITADVTFTDRLTGRSFHLVQMFTITLPAQ